MKQKILNYHFLVVIVLTAVLIFSCKKKEEPDVTSDQIKILSLTASINPVKAWDTTFITCEAEGEYLIYTWDYDHGYILGDGPTVKYAAGECCVGVNTITCKVSNVTGSVSDTIKVTVTSYFAKND
ncbi:MAG: hypothetical protein ABIJ97_09910 [Bacteroidota bacterium]